IDIAENRRNESEKKGTKPEVVERYRGGRRAGPVQSTELTEGQRNGENWEWED
ncbi:hypothetical protein K474DRAFT_1664680, partial [Panus rudis PR-1116 ss-1]